MSKGKIRVPNDLRAKTLTNNIILYYETFWLSLEYFVSISLSPADVVLIFNSIIHRRKSENVGGEGVVGGLDALNSVQIA